MTWGCYSLQPLPALEGLHGVCWKAIQGVSGLGSRQALHLLGEVIQSELVERQNDISEDLLPPLSHLSHQKSRLIRNLKEILTQLLSPLRDLPIIRLVAYGLAWGFRPDVVGFGLWNILPFKWWPETGHRKTQARVLLSSWEDISVLPKCPLGQTSVFLMH